MNRGSANSDAFVSWHLTKDQLTTRLSLQVAGTAIFMFLRLGHVHAHVTPPHYTKLRKEVENIKHCMLKYPRFANLALIGNSAVCASAEP